jgi:hypothetical protein
LGEFILQNKDIRNSIADIFKNIKTKKKLSNILKRKNNYYLKDDSNETICKISTLDKTCMLFIKEGKNWSLISKGTLKEILNYFDENNKTSKTILFTSDQIKRLNRGIYRYVESKCHYISNKDFEAKARFGRIYFDFYIDDIFRVNIYDNDFKDCSLFIQKGKEWEKLKTGNFDKVMKYLDTYFKNHYINDKII